MPVADTQYLVGVIREWEKRFLGSDEYTRLIDAPSYSEAVRVLSETPYQSINGLERHLEELHSWLIDSVEDERAIRFASAKFDALNIATCLLQHKRGLNSPDVLSSLGSIHINALQSAIWNDLDWEIIPSFWEELIRSCLGEEKSATEVLEQVAEKLLLWQEQLAFTPLTKSLAKLARDRFEGDKLIRPFVVNDGSGLAASKLDKEWDEKTLSILRKHRLEVEGFDPILSFWFAKEIEIRTIRLLLAASLLGVAHDDVSHLERTFYLSFV